LAFPSGSRRWLASSLAVLALAGTACFGGPRSESPLLMPSPEFGAGSDAAVASPRKAGAPASMTPAAPKPAASARQKTPVGAKAPAVKASAARASAAKSSTAKASTGKSAGGNGASAKAPPSKAPVRKAPAGTAPAAEAPATKAPIAKAPIAKAPRVLVDSTALEFAVTARLAHEPLTRAIARRTRNPELAERAAWAVTREAGRLRMSPSLLAAVLLVENRQLDSSAVSSQGAIGLMQVMPMHAGSYGCESADLMNVDANICHGARILHLYMVRSRSVSVALKRYNGCVRGANTPRCYRYPVRVLRTAARLRHDILASATPGDQRVRM
jgi:soluble lytic murein transglycosylase-like protein